MRLAFAGAFARLVGPSPVFARLVGRSLACLGLPERLGEGLGGRRARLGWSGRERPTDEAEGELGVARFVDAHPLEHATHARIARALVRLRRFERRHRLAHAPFDDRKPHRLAERARLERALHRQGARPDRLAAERRREPEAEAGVLELVAHGRLRPGDELGRRPERQELQGEAGEGGDRRVLHLGAARPVGAQLGAQGFGQRAGVEYVGGERPVGAGAQGGDPVFTLDPEGAA